MFMLNACEKNRRANPSREVIVVAGSDGSVPQIDSTRVRLDNHHRSSNCGPLIQFRSERVHVSNSAVALPSLCRDCVNRARRVAVAFRRRMSSPASAPVATPRSHWNSQAAPALSFDMPLAPPLREQRLTVRPIATAPPWLVSLAVHLAAVLSLASWQAPATRTQTSPQSITLTGVDTAELQPLESFPVLRMEVVSQDANSYDSAASDSVDAAHYAADSAAALTFDVGILESDFHLPKMSEPAALFATGGGAMHSFSESSQGAEFFGLPAKGDKFVFVVDNSNSMRSGKLEAAKQELLYAIQRLSADQSFYVFFFHGTAVPMSLNDTGEPEPEPLLASTENIAKLQAWVATVEVAPWTDPSQAMRRALTMLPDAIYLLSDGKFTDRGETVRLLKRDNFVRDTEGRRPKVVVHTVGFHNRDGEPTLKNIARSYGGTYRFVPPPK
jgi:hypothetical protein